MRGLVVARRSWWLALALAFATGCADVFGFDAPRGRVDAASDGETGGDGGIADVTVTPRQDAPDGGYDGQDGTVEAALPDTPAAEVSSSDGQGSGPRPDVTEVGSSEDARPGDCSFAELRPLQILPGATADLVVTVRSGGHAPSSTRVRVLDPDPGDWLTITSERSSADAIVVRFTALAAARVGTSTTVKLACSFGGGAQVYALADVPVLVRGIAGRYDEVFGGGNAGSVEHEVPEACIERFVPVGIAVQSDGSIVAAARAQGKPLSSDAGCSVDASGYYLARHRSDGRPDSALGPAGHVRVSLPHGQLMQAGAPLVRPDDSVLVPITALVDGHGCLGLQAWTRDLQPDTTFGVDGVAWGACGTNQCSPEYRGFLAATLLSDGSTVVAADVQCMQRQPARVDLFTPSGTPRSIDCGTAYLDVGVVGLSSGQVLVHPVGPFSPLGPLYSCQVAAGTPGSPWPGEPPTGLYFPGYDGANPADMFLDTVHAFAGAPGPTVYVAGHPVTKPCVCDASVCTGCYDGQAGVLRRLADGSLDPAFAPRLLRTKPVVKLLAAEQALLALTEDRTIVRMPEAVPTETTEMPLPDRTGDALDMAFFRSPVFGDQGRVVVLSATRTSFALTLLWL